jgi:hypothetical protein
VTTVKYFLMIHNSPELFASLSKEEMDELMGAHGPFQEELKASGELVAFAALADPANTRLVKTTDGVPVVTDGPFLEAKEFLGGYYIVDCDGIDRAVEIAAKLPETRYLGIEIRPVMHEAGLEM